MEASRERTDGELLAAFADGGDQSAFGELVQRYGSMVHGVCLRVVRDHHEAEDAAQAVFLTLARKASSLRRDPSVGGWLHTVARRLAKDVRNARYRREAREDRAMRDQMIQDRQESDLGGFREELDEAIGGLPERYRLPLVLFHLRGCSLEQTASQLRLNANTASTRLARAREMLRRKLVRRGVAVGSVGALTTLLSAEAGAAVLPASFVSATAKAAGLAAAGKLAAGVGAGAVSAKVAALTKGACNMLFWSSVKTAAIAVAVTGAVVGTGTVVAQKAMDATPTVAVASEPRTVDLRSLFRLRREGNLLACEWICPTVPAGLGRFETSNPRLDCVAYGVKTSITGPATAAEIYGTNMAERAGTGIWHFRMRADAANTNFWVMVMYGTKAPIACIEYIQGSKQLRLIRTVWTADGRLDPDNRLDVSTTGPDIEELKAKAGDELRKHLVPVLAMITPQDLMNSAGDKAMDGPALAAAVKGEKVLVQFWHYPLVNHPNRLSDAEIVDGRKNIGGKIAQALKAANVEVVRFLWGQDGKEGADRSSYSAMVLLDCKGRRPEEALASVPYRVAGIVFKDGVYERALPVETESKWLVTAKKGQVPAPCAFYLKCGSYGDIQQGKKDVERFRTIPAVHVEVLPLSGATPGGWRAKMTPTPGHTLLEVFLLTEAGFLFVDPNQTAKAPTEASGADQPAKANFDPTRLESAPVVVRARMKPRTAGAVGSVGPFMTQFTTLVVTEVLKDLGGRGPKAGAEIGLAHDQREPLPAGEFTAYLEPEVLKLAGGERVRYIFTGAVAQGAKYPGARLGTSHAVAEK